jgi:hypothetical protein
MIISAVSGFLYGLQRRSLRLQAADKLPEHTWLNHGLITLGAGLIGAAVGWPVGIALLGAKIGCAIGVACYATREVRQWWNAPKPAGWWWDACLDVAFPVWFASAVIVGPWAFLGMAVIVALFHFALRPIE